MSLLERLNSIFDSPSRRKGVDYTKAISDEAKTGVFLLLYQYQGNVGEWFRSVADDFVHARLDFIPYRNRLRTLPLKAFQAYLLNPSTESVAFLDFLEIAFRNNRARRDNDLIRAINRVLDDRDCPYKLTEFTVSITREGPSTRRTVTAYPSVYLAQESVIETHAIMPALALFADPAFYAPDKYFRKALKRHKDGDYEGCITLCSTAVEGTLKVVAKKRGWSLKGSGVGALTKSFIRKAKLPDKLKEVAALLAERRFNAGDAHGHERVAEATEAEARFLIGLSAAFIVLVASELP